MSTPQKLALRAPEKPRPALVPVPRPEPRRPLRDVAAVVAAVIIVVALVGIMALLVRAGGELTPGNGPGGTSMIVGRVSG